MAELIPPAPAGEEFEAAKIVFETLRGLTRERQERVLRWVSETLGIANSGAPKLASAPPPQQVIHAPVPPPATPTPPPARTLDIRSFVEAKQPRSDIQYVTVAAYYFRFEAPLEERRATIDAQFAQETTRMAGRDRLMNPKNTLNNAKAQGYLDSPARGQFSVSTVGENLVVRGLPGIGEDTSRGGGRSLKKTPKKKTGAKKPAGKKKKKR